MLGSFPKLPAKKPGDASSQKKSLGETAKTPFGTNGPQRRIEILGANIPQKRGGGRTGLFEKNFPPFFRGAGEQGELVGQTPWVNTFRGLRHPDLKKGAKNRGGTPF